MLTFAVVVRKPGRRIPDHVTAVLRNPRPSALAFVPDADVHWTDTAGSVAFGGWQCATDRLGMGSHWAVDEASVHAFTGHLWPRGGSWELGRSWASQLADRCAKVPLSESVLAFEGVYSAVSLSSDGRGSIINDPVGLGLLYQAESDDVVVISSRAQLAAELVTPPGRQPARDTEGVGWLVYAGRYTVGDRTGFEAVRAVPLGSSVEVRPDDGVRVRTWSTMPWLPDGFPAGTPVTGDELSAAIDEVREQLVTYVRTAASFDADHHVLELTGGKDSRLILSLLVAGEVAERFECVTWGSDTLPDQVVATTIAERFGLPHRRAMPRPRRAGREYAPPATFEERVRHHVWLSGGMLTSWDGGGTSMEIPSHLALCGITGESLRTNYYAMARLESMDHLWELLPKHHLFGYGRDDLLRPEVREHYDSKIVEMLQSLEPPVGASPQDVIDGYFLRVHVRRLNGTEQEHNRRGHLFPLYSLPAIRLAFSMGPGPRRAALLPFELMRRSCDELAAMPFDKGAWPEEAFSHLPDAHRYRHGRPTPKAPKKAMEKLGGLPGRPKAKARPKLRMAVNERHERSADERLPVLRQLLDLGANHPLYELVDRRALERALDGYAGIELGLRHKLNGAVTAAVWLDRSEAPAPGALGPAG